MLAPLTPLAALNSASSAKVPMTAEVQKYTLEQIEALEIAPGTEHEQLEGWVPSLASDEEVRQALEKAFDYRGDVTMTLKDGRKVEAYIFNRQSGKTLQESFIQFFEPNVNGKQKISYAEIARLEFTGKDRAAGKHWEDWVKAYNERKAAGEKGIALHPDKID